MSAILSRLLSDLNIAVLERKEDGGFTLISSPPDWLSVLWPDIKQQTKKLLPGEVFYFLDDFLERNASFWDNHTTDQKTSGVWIETTPDGNEQMLEAVALFIDDHPLLMLRVPYHQEIWPIYQQAREQRLEYEQLIDEINKREVLLHCIVHDLSNPLAGIKGSLRLLDTEDMVADDRSELLKIGLRQASKMQNLISSILSTFANEVKPIVPTLIGDDVAPDMHHCTREVMQSLAATAALKGVSIQIDGQGVGEALPAPLKVIGETERLERVLYNLVANAIRHSIDGQTITIAVDEEKSFVRTSIIDEGPGVPDDLLENLFDRFAQGNAGMNGQAGLGLYFCRITVEGWGGSIGYEPAAGGGARFWFRLPKPVKHEDLKKAVNHA